MKKIFALILIGLFLFGCLEQTPAPTPSPSAVASPTAAANATTQASPTQAPSSTASQTPSATAQIPYPSVTPEKAYCIFRTGDEDAFEGPKALDVSAEFFFSNETNATIDCSINSTVVNISADTRKAFYTCSFPVYTSTQKFTLKATAGQTTCNSTITIVATKPPAVTNVNSTVLSSTSAVVIWSTSRPTTTNFEYGINSYGTSVKGNQSIAEHSVSLNTLTANSTYQFRITACDQLGLCTTTQDVNTFQTPV